ncbi:fimbrial protein [Pseudomonas chlororaphis]
MFHAFIKSVLVPAILLWVVANTAMALTCDYQDGVESTSGDMRLQISAISVGRDVPLGTEVYRQKFNIASNHSPTVECKNFNVAFSVWHQYVVELSKGIANWSSGKYANKVHKTNIQGIGVAFEGSNGQPLPWSDTPRPTTCTPTGKDAMCKIPFDKVTNYDLILIKIGDVSPGLLDGDDLPKIFLIGHFEKIQLDGFAITTTGTIQIVSPTCDTPDVVVPMGEHQTKIFTGLNSASGWRDFSIPLNNCPAFHGTYSTNAPTWTSEGGSMAGGKGTKGSPTNNSLQYRIDPARRAINVSNGVLSLDPADEGDAAAATGIGLQIATPNNVSVPLGTNRNSGLNLQASEGSYSIPLRARYLQIGNKVMPGPANASATFTIIYQ